MASQRITIAKIGGASGILVAERLRLWSASRFTTDRSEWSPDQWPADVRRAADDFVTVLKAQSQALPVLYYAEWVDLWSMGDVIARPLLIDDNAEITTVYTNQFEIYSYELPDKGLLMQRVDDLRGHECQEYDWYRTRLREATEAWSSLVEQATILVIREPLGGLATDDEVLDSMASVPPWLS